MKIFILNYKWAILACFIYVTTKFYFMWIYQYNFNFVVYGCMLLFLYPSLSLSPVKKEGVGYSFNVFAIHFNTSIVCPSVYHKIQSYLC